MTTSILAPWTISDGPGNVLSVSVSLRTVCFCPECTESWSERVRSSFRGLLRSGLLAVACCDISNSTFEEEPGESSSTFEDSLEWVKRLSNNIERFRRKLKSCENTNANKPESLRLVKFAIDVMVSNDLQEALRVGQGLFLQESCTEH